MSIELFKRVFKPRSGDKPNVPYNEATERLKIDQDEKNEKINSFLIEWGLNDVEGYEQLNIEDINNLQENFIDKKTGLSDEDKLKLKNEVRLKVEAIIAGKFKQAA